MKPAYYNEIDSYCCAWLENLVLAELIPFGWIDQRPIQQVQPEDLEPYGQCHFFAGLGGWAYAMRLAGWPEDREVWTGSCPCQPFSKIGQRRGFDDERHLWPEWFRLAGKLHPATVFGEQVDEAKSWLDLVLTDLENIGYACATADLPAACVGAPHIRQRLWFVADADSARWSNVKGFKAPAKKAHFGTSAGVVPSSQIEHIRGPFEPSQDWIVDGAAGVSSALHAIGNAIVPQVAATFVRAFLEAEKDLASVSFSA